MDVHFEAEKILTELQFDFVNFTLDGFLRFVGDAKGREIIAIPWDNMPPALFGAWISDGDKPQEYIFYRSNASIVHQIHIQLHEVSHFIYGHPTLQINRQFITEVIAGTASLPFADLPQLRSPKRTNFDVEAETLANLIQERVIRASRIDRLIHDTSPEEKLANFLRKMSLP